MILIPPGMGNAFYVKSSSAIYHYKLAYSGNYIDADEQFTIAWNDPLLNIKWSTNDPILSKRDARL
jgi:dTDP-4-dehydrorhamnose 3,5-epimerase